MPRTIKQASDLAGQKLERSIIITREAIDQEARTVQLAFASETPCERWYGFEILDCKPKSIRMDRLLSGGPLLLGHDAEEQIGVVESVTVGEDGICRATCRFSRSELGEEILQDVVDGIRRNVSVGYMIHEAVMEKQDDAGNHYRVTDWEPYEVSIVPMPADCSVGVGRGLDTDTQPQALPVIEQPKEKRAMNKCIHCGAELAEGATCTCSAVRAAEQKRVNDLMTRAADYAERGGVQIAADLLREKPAATVEDFNARMLDEITKTQAKPTAKEPDQFRSPIVTTSLHYDRRALDPWKNQGLSHTQAEERAYEAGQFALAVIYGNERAAAWCRDHNINLRAMSEGVDSAGGYLVPDSLATGIIDFRLQYGVARQLAQYWPMASATTSVPVVSSGPIAFFAGENAGLTPADLGLSNANLVAKKLTALTLLSKEVIEDAVIDLANLVADRQGYAFAGKEDACLVDGDGTSTYGGITGLKALLETSGMAGIYTTDTGADSAAEITAVHLSMLAAKLPSYARRGAAWLSSPAFDEAVFGRLMAAAGGNTKITLANGTADAYNGKPRFVNEFCYSALDTTDYTGKAVVFYGDFKQGVLFGERRGISIEVLRERYADQDSIGVKGTERIDINAHGVGSTSAAGPIVAMICG